MLSKTSTFLVVASLAAANAACPNSCSGHGTCGAQEVCTCYDNWGMGGMPGGDCSDRLCPYELAWVDSPSKTGGTHQYAECSAKGICDRTTGECDCVAGYTGKACARQVCPDDCSGHGTCNFMDDLSYAFIQNDDKQYFPDTTPTWDSTYNSEAGSSIGVSSSPSLAWDSSRSRACVCDATWSGINCASRMCPYGNDALATRADTSDTLLYQVQTIYLAAGNVYGKGMYNVLAASNPADGASYESDLSIGDPAVDYDGANTLRQLFADKTFALTFTSKINETFTTIPIKVPSDWDVATVAGASVSLADQVKSALQNLPNKVIDAVTVTTEAYINIVNSGENTAAVSRDVGVMIKVTFDGASVHGKQNLLEVSVDQCGDGCTPKLSGIDTLVTSTAKPSYVAESVVADYNSYECGRRGKCDSDTGVCACFEGFTGEACTQITALV